MKLNSLNGYGCDAYRYDYAGVDG
ncbi:hypothetical protein H1P_2750003 [Hyella patelloides LEGE 07179]|uniref:Uncharacterized protein n=1 Tax=Hyella patelloides LEGE 07179 TaxID=945734 RepID=A0A563VT43_9CYAN|nr:hypothetical protein H1P_2750003 [Hyella patelloides LEGE 07179]